MRRPQLLAAVISVAVLVVSLAVTASPAAVAAPAPATPAAGTGLGGYDPGPTGRTWTTGPSSGAPTSRPADSALLAGAGPDGELPRLRTENSSTFVQGGQLQTRFSTMPVNFPQAGVWEKIDNTLIPAENGLWRNRAGSHQVAMPALSGSPVSVTKDGLTVTSVLLGGAKVSAQPSGATATYPGVFPGVDELFTVRPGVLEQSFRLASPEVASEFTQTVTLTAGYTLGSPDANGGLPIRNAKGEAVAAIPAPVLTDASQNPDTNVSTVDASYRVSGAAPVWTVTTVVNHEWLAAPERVFPVLLDPSTTFGTSNSLGCYVTNPAPGTPADPKLCSSTTGTDNDLVYGSTAYVRRAFLKFGDLTSNTSPVPLDAVVTNADLVLTQHTASTANPLDTGVYQPASDWDSTITWATQPSNTPTPQASGPVTPPGLDQPVKFNITDLVDRWVGLTTTNRGVIIRLKNEAASNTLGFYGLANAAHHPELVVTWVPKVGQEKAVGSYNHRLTDRMDLHVAYGTRNLVVNGLDDQISGPGIPLTVRRTYNSLLAANGISGAYGLGWSMSGGVDTGLVIAPGTVTFTQPGGARAVFQRNLSVAAESSTGAYYNRNGLNADLIRPDSTHYTMTFRQSKMKYTFTLPTSTSTTAWLSSAADRSGNTVTYTSSGSPLVTTKLTDTTGNRSVTFGYSAGRVTTMTETLAAGATGARTMGYSYDSYTGYLTTFTDPAGKITRFCYTGALLTRIISPRGSTAGVTCTSSSPMQTTDIAYDSAGKVLTVSYRNGASPALVIGFDTTIALAYPSTEIGKTTFTDAYGKTSNYSYDVDDRVTNVVNPLGDTRSSTYNTNSDVTASVSATNYTGGTTDPSTTSTFDVNNNKTSTAMPTGANVTADFTGPQAYQPAKISDDRDTSVTGPAATALNYGSTGLVTSTSKGTTTYTSRYQGDSGVANCGPAGAAAYGGALCETRDGLYSATFPNRHRAKYSYNAMGQLVSMTPAQPDNSRTTPPAETYAYDGFSRVTSSTNSRGQTTTYSYDAMDRLTRTTYADGTYTQLVYDDDGDQLSQTDKTAAGTTVYGVTYVYDALNRSISEQPTGKAANTVTWDANSRMLTFSDGSGITLTYGYDDAGSLTSMAQPGGSCAGFSPTAPPTVASLCTIFSIDKNGRRKAAIYPGNLARQEYTYDNAGRVTNITGRTTTAGAPATAVDLTYSYTESGHDTGHIITRTDNTISRTTTYTYTNEGRLQHATSRDPSNNITARFTYCYDTNGNRTSAQTGATATCPGTANSTWDGANGQLTGPTGTAGNYQFDVDGNETSSGTSLAGAATRTDTWTNRDQNSGVSIGGGAALPNNNLGAGNTYLYRTKINSTDSQVLRNSFTGVTEVTVDTGSGVASQVYVQREPSGAIAGFVTYTGVHYYPLTDNLGSILYTVDNTGNPVSGATYQPFGAQTITTAAPFTQPFGYTGAYTQPTTGLLHLSARYYDPTLGRFTQQDPSGQDNNPYTYAGNDPINHVDPNGLDFDWIDELLGAAVATIVGSFCTIGAVVCAAGASFAAVGAVAGAEYSKDESFVTFDDPIDTFSENVYGSTSGPFLPFGW